MEDIRKKIAVTAVALIMEAAKRLGLTQIGAREVWAAAREWEEYLQLMPEAARAQVNNLARQLWDYLMTQAATLTLWIISFLEF